ncbi:TPA: hypothetical protein LVN11_000785 [Klebsiella oxytoca]|nr:hypothetical protein [Klebsiella oxytoca]
MEKKTAVTKVNNDIEKSKLTSESISEDLHSEELKTPVCGIIMPIADTDGYPNGHWANVYDIICEASTQAGFRANLVSFDDDVAVIQKRIVQNIYDNPIVVCDISAKNANVMFELGMRLAFDKPTVIVKDEKTPYSFDISSIEHLEYPSDLRYQSINEFKKKLAGKIKETYQKSKDDPSYTTFLKHFGTFKIAQIEEKEVSENTYLALELKEIKSMMVSILRNSSNSALNQMSKPLRVGNILNESDQKIALKKVSETSYSLEFNNVLVARVMLKTFFDNLRAAGFKVTQYTSRPSRVLIEFESPLTDDNEKLLKDLATSFFF